MLGLIAPLLMAIVAALAIGGSLDHWARLRLRWWPLALLALAVQVAVYTPPLNAWPAIVAIGPVSGILSTGVVLAVVVRNGVGPLRWACGLAATGIALNLAVIVANGGWMPRADALAPRPVDRGALGGAVTNTAPMAPETRLAWLGDSIPEPAWLPMANLVSPGDVLLSLGAAWWAFAVTRGQARRASGAWGV